MEINAFEKNDSDTDYFQTSNAAAQKLARDMAQWEKAVDNHIATQGKGSKKKAIRVMTTPLVFHLTLGKQIRELYINPAEMHKILTGHHKDDNEVELVKKVPEALTNPIFIFQRYVGATKSVKPDHYDVIVDLQNPDGYYYLVRVLVDQQDKRRAKINLIGSVHPKENYSWYYSNFKNDQLLYIGTKKGIIPSPFATGLLSSPGATAGLLNSPGGEKVDSLASTVPLSVMDVKQEISDAINRANAAGKKIYTEADLDQLKAQTKWNGYYQNGNGKDGRYVYFIRRQNEGHRSNPCHEDAVGVSFDPRKTNTGD